MDNCTETIKQLSIDNATPCSLHYQLEIALSSFQSSTDFQWKQQACIVFTMQLLYGTLGDRLPLECFCNTVELCIYYCQMSSIYQTVFDTLKKTPIEQCCCADLLEDSTNKWTTNATALLTAFNNELWQYSAINLRTLDIQSLSKQTTLKHVETAMKYIYWTLFDIATAATQEEFRRQLSSAQRQLFSTRGEDETATVLNTLTKHTVDHGYDYAILSKLLNTQMAVLEQTVFLTNNEDDNNSEASTECNCIECQTG